MAKEQPSHERLSLLVIGVVAVLCIIGFVALVARGPSLASSGPAAVSAASDQNAAGQLLTQYKIYMDAETGGCAANYIVTSTYCDKSVRLAASGTLVQCYTDISSCRAPSYCLKTGMSC